jgi:tripartite-type tricarboxylate transporter receptor subunit TctC
MKRRRFIAVGGAAAMSSGGWPASAEEPYPSRPVHVVVPYAPGGGLDMVTRIVLGPMAARLGQPFLVENRTGASGMVGVGAVAKAKPDGYTLLATVADTQINNAVLFKQLPYDPLNDFVPVTQMAYGAPIMVTNADLPTGTLAEFVAQAKANSGKLSYGSWGIGGLGHLMTEAFNQAAGLAMTHIPYRGEMLMLQDLLNRSVTLGMCSMVIARQHIQSGSLRAIAVSGPRRFAALPDTATFAEQGFDDPAFAVRAWIGLLAPARTPPAVVNLLQRELSVVVHQPAVRADLAERGFESAGNTPGEFAAALKRDYQVITGLIRRIGITPQ